MEQGDKLSSGATANHIDHINQINYIEEDMPLDFDDPHRAALEDNPEQAEKLTLSTALAVLVRTVEHLHRSSTRHANSISSFWPCPRSLP